IRRCASPSKRYPRTNRNLWRKHGLWPASPVIKMRMEQGMIRRTQASTELQRGLSTGSALGLNIIDMVGVGPFVTLPLIVAAMGGPQAMLGWIVGAVLSLCDGLIWSELGTA